MSASNATDFALLKQWIKDFKSEQGRDPFFEDFPASIGLEWKRWKAHKQKSAEVRSEKPAYAAGTYGAKLPAKSALHNHQHAAGFRGGMSSQSNPFSRVPKVEVASKRGSDTRHDRQANLGSSSMPTGLLTTGPSPEPPPPPVQAEHISPLKETNFNRQQAVRGFGQIAAQKKQLGLLPAINPATAPGLHALKPQQQPQQQQPKLSRSTNTLHEASATATKAVQMHPISPASKTSSGANAAASNTTAAKQKCPAGVQQSKQVLTQAVPHGADEGHLHSLATKLCKELPGNPQPQPQESTAQHGAGDTSRSSQAEASQNDIEIGTGARANSAGTGTATNITSKTIAAAQKQGSRGSLQHKRPLTALQSSEGQAAKRAKPACAQTSPKAGSMAQWTVSKSGPAAASPASAEADAKNSLQPRRQVACKSQKGKTTKSAHSQKASRAGKACTAGQALPLADDQSPAMLADTQPAPARRQGLRMRKAAAAVVDDTSGEEEGFKSEYADPLCTSADKSGDDAYQAHRDHAAIKPARMTRLHRHAAAAVLPDLNGDNINQRQSQLHVSKPDGQLPGDESAAHSSDTEDDSNADMVAESPEQANGRAGKSSTAPARGHVQRSAGPQRAKRDSAGSAQRAASSSRGGHRCAATRQNFVRCNLRGGKSKKFLSKSAARGRSNKGGGRFGRFKTKFLPQAGDGADYLEGYKDPYHVCFKCGRAGHWAQQCPGLLADGQAVDDGSDTDTEQPTIAKPVQVTRPAISSNLHLSYGLEPFEAPPLEELTDDRLADCLKSAFGYGGFRGQQLEVVRRVLDGKSTLAVLPTGSGKSLCYQLPALLLGGTCLVVSPLIALMRDQLTRLPPYLPAAMLWGGQSKQEAMQVLADLKAGKLRVLYVAPERLHSGVLLEALGPLMPLPLVCVDEAHCVAEWGHNFRSAYFRLGQMLEQKVQCRCVLALTATATKATEADVTKVLNITPANVVRDSTVRDNLRLSVKHFNGGSAGGATRRAVLKLLQQEPLKSITSIIVYCTFQAQADEVAQYLYTQGISALAYHAGKPFKDREHIQESFCAGKTKVVVATVAFGMGVDAQGVRGVVHMTLPRSLEEYVQQIGRAGRDGSESYCHLFLDDADFLRLRSLAHSDGIDASNAHAFLVAVFHGQSEHAANTAESSSPAYGTVAVAQVAEQCDMKEEVMETLLSYLEADGDPLIQVLPSTGATISVSFYDTAPQKLAADYAIVDALLKVCPKQRRGCHTADTAELMNAAGLPATQVMKELQALAIKSELRFEVSKQTALAFAVQRMPQDCHQLAGSISQRHGIVSQQQAHRLDVAYCSFAAAVAASKADDGFQSSAAAASATSEVEVSPEELWLRKQIMAYFESEQELTLDGLPALPVKASAPTLKMDIRALLIWADRHKPGCMLTGRAIARILHGVASPAFPPKQWSKCGFWQQYTNVDFAQITALAQQEVNVRRQNKEYAAALSD